MIDTSPAIATAPRIASDLSVTAALDERTRRFRRWFMCIVSSSLSVVALVAITAYAILSPYPRPLLAVGLTVIACLGALVLALTHRVQAAAYWLLWGIGAGAGLAMFWRVGDSLGIAAIEAFFVVVIVAPFFLSRRATLWLLAVSDLTIIAAHVKAVTLDGLPSEEVVPTGVITATLLVALCVSIQAFSRHAEENQNVLRRRLMDIDTVVERARRIATGDLAGDVRGTSDVSDVVRAMLGGLRELVQQIQETSTRLSSATQEIAAMSKQQEQSSVEQGSAVEETRRTIEAMLDASREIAVSAEGVTRNAESTQRNAERIDGRIGTLTRHTKRITEILEIVKDVANKSELLALNAALEGAKAGESGRGFSLVASRMQRLAEDVMSSVKDVRSLTENIQEATEATALATEDATKLAADTTEAARRIRLITQQQQSSTEQVTQAMDDIANATKQTSSGTNETLQAARELSDLAERLNGYVARFQL